MMKSVLDFAQKKIKKEKISMVTCYDYTFAKVLSGTQVDCLLVGDSVAMTIHGYTSTLPATTEIMALHTAAVARGAGGKFIVGDMPFLSNRKGLREAMNCVDALMKAGAQAVKLEGVEGHEDIVSHIVKSGVPVMGHLGLTPQSIHQMGGFKVQGRQEVEAKLIAKQSLKLEDLGCFALVLECVPSALARTITESLQIPTIGIGAGSGVDGQVLVLQDLLGMNDDFKPKFLRKYLNGATLMRQAFDEFAASTREGTFPTAMESYDS